MSGAKSIILGALCTAQIASAADPLDNWTTSTVSLQGGLVAAAFGNGLFVGVGSLRDTSGNFLAGTIATSPDGVTWTQGNSGITNRGLAAVTYGNGQFVAVGGQPQVPSGVLAAIVTSSDGITWVPANTGATNVMLYSMTYGNGRFVAAGSPPSSQYSATVLSSSDGVNWTTWYWTRQPSWDNPLGLNNVAFGNGQFVAVGGGTHAGSVATSPDGVNWTQHYGVGPGTQIAGGGNALTFGNGLFVAVGGYDLEGPLNQEHATIWSSPDGLNWTLQLDYTNVLAFPGTALVCVGYGAGQFVAGGNMLDPMTGKPAVYTSADGTNWVARDLSAGVFGLAFGNGRFVGLPGGTKVVQSGVIGKLGASLSPGTGVQGTVTGVTGQRYAIQASTNLASWTPVTTVTISTNGIAPFSDTSATNFSGRFYAAQLVQH